jgi:hypothetical protein
MTEGASPIVVMMAQMYGRSRPIGKCGKISN